MFTDFGKVSHPGDSTGKSKAYKAQFKLNDMSEIMVTCTVFSKEYKVTRLTDRMGMRLEGEKIENIKSKNIKSEGITKGSIQVPGDGQPIVLLSDHPTIGGYPKIANVITADYDKLVQKTPESKLKFKLVDLSVAESAFQLYTKKINSF